jgi:cytochrome c553
MQRAFRRSLHLFTMTMPGTMKLLPRLAVALALLGVASQPLYAAALAERMTPCLACHGTHGRSETVEVPSLGGQPAPYLLIQLYLFREKQRVAEIMNVMTLDFTDEDLRAFADAIANLPPPQPQQQPPDVPDAARMQSGRALIGQHRCNTCHNLELTGHDNIPRIADQREDYLVKTLRDYKSNARQGYDGVMAEVLAPVTDAQILDLAYYLARFR